MSTVGRVLVVVIFVAFCNRAVPLCAQGDARQELSTDDEQASAFIRPVEMGQVVGQPAGPAPTPRHTGIKAMMKDLVSDVAHLPSTENLYWASVGGGLALAVHPADDNVNQALVNSDAAHNFFVPGKSLGQPIRCSRWPSQCTRSAGQRIAESVARRHGPHPIAARQRGIGEYVEVCDSSGAARRER